MQRDGLSFIMGLFGREFQRGYIISVSSLPFEILHVLLSLQLLYEDKRE